MIKLVAVLISFFTICMSILAQDSLDQPQEDVSVLSISRGIAETIDLAQAYLVNGRKKERTLRSDYYEAVGILSLDEGEWSIVAAGLGGRDKTTFAGSDFRGVDVELQASPQRCFRLLASKFGKAFEIKCPLRSLRFSMRSDSSQTVVLITQLLPRNQTGDNSTAGRTATTTVAPRPTIASAETLYEIASIAPNDVQTGTPTPTRTPFPTADPESGTYHISRSGGVNVRSCASTSCSVVANYEFGKSLSVTGFENGQTIGGSSRWAKTITGDYIHSSLLTRGSPPVTATQKPRVTTRSSSTGSTNRTISTCETQRILDELRTFTASYGRCNIDGAYMKIGDLESSCGLIYHYWTDKPTPLERLTERRRFAQYLAFVNDEYELNLELMALQTWDKSCTVNLGWEFFNGEGEPLE